MDVLTIVSGMVIGLLAAGLNQIGDYVDKYGNPYIGVGTINIFVWVGICMALSLVIFGLFRKDIHERLKEKK